jgi:hypothetical protein
MAIPAEHRARPLWKVLTSAWTNFPLRLKGFVVVSLPVVALLLSAVLTGFKGSAQYVELALYLGVGSGIAVIGGLMRATHLSNVRRLQQALEDFGQIEEPLRLTPRSSGVAVWSWDIAQIPSRRMKIARPSSAFRSASSRKRSRGSQVHLVTCASAIPCPGRQPGRSMGRFQVWCHHAS